jgi:hypothetical protein
MFIPNSPRPPKGTTSSVAGAPSGVVVAVITSQLLNRLGPSRPRRTCSAKTYWRRALATPTPPVALAASSLSCPTGSGNPGGA